MITKFENKTEQTSIEFENSGNGSLLIVSKDYEHGDVYHELTESDLFSLIGQLLRIQSELKKKN
tara:strand:+ start:146 stop:337 length:192 start_codon:yes stop_codon:yes gene_type:complete